MAAQHIFGLVLFLAVAAPASTAFAQRYPACTKAVSANESELAHQKYIAGKQDYDEGNYESALRRFRDAYALDCTKHELLIIISAGYERKGDRNEAIVALETYIARAPSAPDVVTYEAKIENLKRQSEAHDAKPPPAAPAKVVPASAPTPPPAPRVEVRGHSPWPWVVVGIGGATAVAGIVLIATTSSLPPNCDEKTNSCSPIAGEPEGALQQRQNEAGKIGVQPKIGLGLAIGGGVLLGSGLLWHFLEPTGPKTAASSTRLKPALGPGYAGMSFGGTF